MYSVTCLNRIAMGPNFPAGFRISGIRIMQVEIVINWVNGTKYDVRYRQDSGLDKVRFRQVTLYVNTFMRINSGHCHLGQSLRGFMYFGLSKWVRLGAHNLYYDVTALAAAMQYLETWKETWPLGRHEELSSLHVTSLDQSYFLFVISIIWGIIIINVKLCLLLVFMHFIS